MTTHLSFIFKKLASPTLLVCATFVSVTAAAQENHERIYQVEMIIFSRAESTTQQEFWPKNISLNYPNNLIALKATGTNDSDGFNMLAANERLLNSQAASIAKSGSYTLLFHQAWRQMVTAKSTAILISGGKTFNGHQELEGNINLSVGQFLKLQTNLWLTQFTPAIEGVDSSDGWPELPNIPNSEIAEHENNYAIKRIVKISQQRSMRSVEVHYVDHPLLGIIIKIIPYNP